MKRSLLFFGHIAALAAALCASACSTTTDDADTTTSATSSRATAQQPTNQRGAVEVTLGQPVSLTGRDGKPLVTITDSRLDSSGCQSVDYSRVPNLGDAQGRIQQAKFMATVKVGQADVTQWLWGSDFYFVSKDGEVVDNLTVSEISADLRGTICPGSVSLVDLPPNSTAKGATTLDIPIGIENGGPIAIGYKVDDQRIEWKLPGGAVSILGPSPTTPATTAPPATPEAEAPTADSGSGLPPNLDQDGDGSLDDGAVGGGDTDEALCNDPNLAAWAATSPTCQ